MIEKLRLSTDVDPKYEWYMSEMVKPDVRLTFSPKNGEPSYVIEVFDQWVYINGRSTELSLTEAVQAFRAAQN